MCTFPDPSSRSIPACSGALVAALAAVGKSTLLLLFAFLSAPFRASPVRKDRSGALGRTDVQVHLGNQACVAELESIIWTTLERIERTWAPMPVPVDRVVVGAGFPAGGRADVYDDYFTMAETDLDADTSKQAERRVVISLGVRDGNRDLDGWEIAGALAAQVQALVDDACQQHRRLATSPTETATVARTSRLSRELSPQETPPTTTTSTRRDKAHWDGVALDKSGSDRDAPTLAELLAVVQKGQPLVAAGPASNGANP